MYVFIYLYVLNVCIIFFFHFVLRYPRATLKQNLVIITHGIKQKKYISSIYNRSVLKKGKQKNILILFSCLLYLINWRLYLCISQDMSNLHVKNLIIKI